MLSHLTKLHLEPGDILVVKDHETLHYLAHVEFKLPFNVPLVFAPQGVQKLSRLDHLNLLQQLDQKEEPILPEISSVPL